MAGAYTDPNRAGDPNLQVDLVLYWYIFCPSISMFGLLMQYSQLNVFC
jgi:hypothetical protein